MTFHPRSASKNLGKLENFWTFLTYLTNLLGKSLATSGKVPGSEFVAPAGRVQVRFKPRKHERFLDVTSLDVVRAEPSRSAAIPVVPDHEALSLQLVTLAGAARAQHDQCRWGVGALLDEGLSGLCDQVVAERVRASIRVVTGTSLAGDPHLGCAAANCAFYGILAEVERGASSAAAPSLEAVAA